MLSPRSFSQPQGVRAGLKLSKGASAGTSTSVDNDQIFIDYDGGADSDPAYWSKWLSKNVDDGAVLYSGWYTSLLLAITRTRGPQPFWRQCVLDNKYRIGAALGSNKEFIATWGIPE